MLRMGVSVGYGNRSDAGIVSSTLLGNLQNIMEIEKQYNSPPTYKHSTCKQIRAPLMSHDLMRLHFKIPKGFFRSTAQKMCHGLE
jgi:hypothetical protein